jgi:hypothetical protein
MFYPCPLPPAGQADRFRLAARGTTRMTMPPPRAQQEPSEQPQQQLRLSGGMRRSRSFVPSLPGTMPAATEPAAPAAIVPPCRRQPADRQHLPQPTAATARARCSAPAAYPAPTFPKDRSPSADLLGPPHSVTFVPCSRPCPMLYRYSPGPHERQARSCSAANIRLHGQLRATAQRHSPQQAARVDGMPAPLRRGPGLYLPIF